MLVLQPSDNSAVCSVRQARILPLPFSTVEQNFLISAWHAAQCLPVPAGAGAASSAAKVAVAPSHGDLHVGTQLGVCARRYKQSAARSPLRRAVVSWDGGRRIRRVRVRTEGEKPHRMKTTPGLWVPPLLQDERTQQSCTCQNTFSVEPEARSAPHSTADEWDTLAIRSDDHGELTDQPARIAPVCVRL